MLAGMNRRPNAATVLLIGVWAALCVAAGPATGPGGGETIRDDRFHFTLRVPEGYTRLPAQPNMLYSLAKVDPDGGMPLGALNVERMHGTIGTEPPVMPPGQPAGARFETREWKGVSVWVFAVEMDVGGTPYTIRTIQLPVTGEAIQLSYGEPTALAGDIDRDVAGVLAGFDAPAGMSAATSSGRTAGGGGLPSGGPVIAGVVWGLLVYAATRRQTAARRPGRAGLIAGGCGVLVIAAVMAVLAQTGSFAPMTASDTPRRMGLLVTGTAQLSGWLGVIVAGIRWATLPRGGPTPSAVPPGGSGTF